MNKILLIGNLGRDAVAATTKSGLSVSKFSIAVSKKYKGQTSTEWFNCVLFGARAEALSQYLKKGTQVFVEGELKSDNYTGKDGVEKNRFIVMVNDVQFLSSKKSEDYSGGQNWSTRPDGNQHQNNASLDTGVSDGFQAPLFSDDIPF